MQNEMNKSHRCGGSSASITVMLMLLLLSVHAAVGRPDVRPSPFALELQPPLAQTAEAFNGAEVGGQRSVDSYGNPIAGLRPIDTPDGRKVVSAQGLQFEIPTYASGITEIRQPADDLLPPHIDAIAVGLAPPSDTSTDPNSFAPDQVSASASASAPAPIPATSLTPPKHSPSPTTTTVTTDVEVEQAQLVQQQQEESVQEPLVASGTLPEYIRELQRQDPDIGGPVPWTPAPNAAPLSVIAWDLLPPHLTDPATTPEPLIITEQQPTRYVQGVEDPTSHNIRLSLSSGDALTPAAPVPQQTQGQVSVVPLQRDGPEAHGTNAHVGSTTPSNAGGRFPHRQRGTAHYSTTRSTTTTARPRSTSTSTTQPPTTEATTTTTTTSTTRRTTTTRRPVTTTRRTTTMQPTPRSTTPLDPSTFYKLDNNEEYAYTLPPWLQEVTDPDLDVAVTFIVPTDNDQYNHTLAEDLEPPYEPFVDLNNIQLTPPPTARPPPLPTTTSSPTTSSSTTRAPTTTSTTTTTTRRSSTLRTTKTPSIPTTHSTTQPPQKPHTTQKPQTPQLIPTTTHHTDLLDGASTPTAATAAAEENPFDSSTVPAWLRDFDYPDVGPGVPYNPDNFKEPASTQPAGARFDPQGIQSSAPAPTQAPKVASEDQFPPFIGGSSTDGVTKKVEYKKSDEGKVISTPISGQRKDTSTPPSNTGKYTGGFGAPAGLLRPQAAGTSGSGANTNPAANSQDSNGGIYVAGSQHEFSNTLKANRARPTVNPGRYTGGFGAPVGVLSAQAEPRPFQQAQQTQQQHSQVASPGQSPGSHSSRFGGPPGVLVPFDNVQRAGGQ
ncbi:mucin-5AC [Drosophila madeirensis]|uniref:Mucin-5AC n=1 Tax=Drosophila madeirensis TaxID=30013 RepID=A0AAU9GFZ2_DROMD